MELLLRETNGMLGYQIMKRIGISTLGSGMRPWSRSWSA
jgi:hypothetical protein